MGHTFFLKKSALQACILVQFYNPPNYLGCLDLIMISISIITMRPKKGLRRQSPFVSCLEVSPLLAQLAHIRKIYTSLL
jgi:hypothetical protein